LRSLLLERWKMRLLVLVLSFVASSFGLLAPWAQKRFADGLLANTPSLQWILFGCVFLVLQNGLNQCCVWLASREGLISQKAMGDSTFHRLLEGPGGLVGRGPAGSAVSLFAVDIPGASALLDQALVMASSMVFPLLLAPIALHALFGIPWWINWGVLAVLALINFLLAARQSRFFFSYKQLAAERTGLVSEWVQNIRTLRILGWIEAAENRIFSLRKRETQNRKNMLTNGQIMNSVATSSTFALNLLAVLLLLKLRAHTGEKAAPSPGELLSLLWILGVFLARPLRQLPWMLVMSLDSLSSLRRLEQAFALPVARPVVAPAAGASGSPPAGVPTALEVSGLTLAAEDGHPLLKGIDFRLPQGALVAVVGDVGSGKSLFLQSLIGGTGARFQRFAFFGEESSGPLDPKVRGKISFVPQEGFTISATLRENVLFSYLDGIGGDPITDARIQRSLRLAQFDPERERVSQGLNSEIGERGVNLSGGQRQRIGLARADYAARPVVLLDDCLSAVDVDTERRLIAELLGGAWKSCTRLLATHRLSILPICDEVWFLQEGAITERGSYEDLLARSADFREFVRREAVKRPEGGQP
jgi:ATP-binding cassette, subfamily B, multidrug efflux pump